MSICKKSIFLCNFTLCKKTDWKNTNYEHIIYFVKDYRVSFSSFLIINGPVWLLLINAILFAILFSYFRIEEYSKLWIIASAVFSWQSICAAILVFSDFKRKLKIERRVLESCDNKVKLKMMLRPLRSTICGIFLSLAIKKRFVKS